MIRHHAKSMLRAAAAAIVLMAASVPMLAQAGRAGAPGPAAGATTDPGVTPAEIQRMFDAYALVQAQQQLAMNDDQYTRFLARYKALQDARRQTLQEHTRIVMDMARMVRGGQAGEAQLKERIQALADADARGAAEIKKASEAIDQLLDVTQQAKFRVFEELMERRKLELVTRARQANRQRQQQQQQP